MDAYKVQSLVREPTNGVSISEPKLKLGGRMSKETAADLHLQLKNMRGEFSKHTSYCVQTCEVLLYFKVTRIVFTASEEPPIIISKSPASAFFSKLG